MKFSFIVSIKGRAKEFSELFAEVVAMDPSREDIEFIVADGGDTEIDLPRLAERLRDEGIGFRLLQQHPGDSVATGYAEAASSASGEVLAYIDVGISLPPDFLAVCEEFVSQRKALVPRPWCQVTDKFDRVHGGYWVPPDYRTFIVAREVYGRGRARWAYRGSKSPLEEFMCVSDFAYEIPVVVAKYPGMTTRLSPTLDSVVGAGRAWSITSPPTSAGIHDNDARGVLHERGAYTCGTVLPAADVPVWSDDVKESLSTVIQEVLSGILSKSCGKPQISKVSRELDNRLWDLYWSSQIPIVPKFTLSYEEDNVRARSLNEVSLPFNREEDHVR